MPSSQNKSPDSFIYFEIGNLLIKRRNTADNLDAIYSKYTNVHKLTKKEFYKKLAERKNSIPNWLKEKTREDKR